ncbi:hypothetical protein QFZ77_003088 [Paenibacillus sp. V4I3]|nr:hypothetical protein [Paenibacillus sp. V4I3]MDQ0874429.1 hypothetical protein [Paenibacillus sp. V4I3]
MSHGMVNAKEKVEYACRRIALGEMFYTFLLFPHIQTWNDGV